MTRDKPGKDGTSPVRSLAVTGGIVAVVLSMVIPLPPVVLDLGIALSISVATLILIMASLVEKPTDFQAFPVLLLISLVIRLTLNVSSTRLILTSGQNGPDAAGQVISGFSEFVAGGSLLVGLTVFAVISIVNFMVITKGSGRMAEVAARFALDSLPGKQLAIDGDLSSGAIDHDEAKRRRVQEQHEISFYGSLDGASKFVKGDAIAGLVITLINLFVGLAAGLFVHSMPVADALSSYSRLTIGDGLVSQIPSLITSMAAALLLSRGGSNQNTAEMVFRQFSSNWQVPALAGGGLFVVGLVPGMPFLIFLAFSGALAVISWRVHQNETRSHNRENMQAVPDEKSVSARIGDIIDTEEICVEIGTGLIASALDGSRGLGQRISSLRIHIARSFGLILPDVRITDAAGLGDSEYTIRLHGVLRGRGVLRAHSALALGNENTLLQIAGENVQEPVYGTAAKWIVPEKQDEAAISGATVVSPMEVLSTHLMEVVKSNLAALLSLSSMQRMIRELCEVSDNHRAQINQRFFDMMIPEKVPPETLLFVLRGLLDEQLSIRHLGLITEAVYEARSASLPEDLYEQVRRRIRSQICEQYTAHDGHLEILHLHPEWEGELSRAESGGAKTSGSALPQLQRKLTDAVRAAATSQAAVQNLILAVPDHRRRLIRTILGQSGVQIPVIGLDEIDPGLKLRLRGVVAA
ncbi:flagellar biosynthesis protein FlhA [Paracoccus ravus]|uniref:flagellar biosynthesis protein FlhA n=1 Tax=Paracoccus ravus TaxID=2447760 RepID=UPI00106E6E40|nr:flagellar biosynthesis protein FlhA [Paracoccus ravus]